MALFAIVLGVGAALHPTALAHSGTPVIQKFDEFGAVRHCDLGARLDNYAIQLENTPRSVGYIFAYAPEGEGTGSGRASLELIKDYLINARGLPERRIKTIYAGRNEDLHQPKIQLWVVPAGVTPPEPEKYETNIDTFKGRFIESERDDDFIDLVWYEEMGPGIGSTTDAAFADMLNQQKKAIPYIVSYGGEEAAPGSARLVAAREIDILKRQKVDVSRIKTIYGGVRKKTTVQLWILPPGDPPPVVDAGAEPPPKKNVQITSQNDCVLGTPANERAVFNRMLELLRDHPTLKAVVIVTLEAKQPEPEPEPTLASTISLPPQPAEPMASAEEPVIEEDPPADLPKLVQKWREELTNTHKINPDRFIVLFTTNSELSGGYLDLWAMPPGQPLPDPNAEKEEDDEYVKKIYENLPPPDPHSLGTRVSALLRGN